MLRQLHSLPGLLAALLVMLLALSGGVLSVNPALERLDAKVPAAGQVSVAELAGRVAHYYPGAEQLQRSPSGALIVYYSENGQAGAERIDPLTGQGIGTYAPSEFSTWVKDLHRSLLLGSTGRAVAGIAALVMLLLSISGLALLAKRLGGWRQLLRPLRGGFSQRWHAEVGRLVVLGLLLSALSGIYMSAANFELIADGMQREPDFPQTVDPGPAAPVASLAALRATDLNDLRELVYPNPSDPGDVYSLRTAQGDGYVDQASGALLSYQAHDSARRVYELIYQLHTGEGLWWLGLLLGVSALSVPLMSITGARLWWLRHQAMPRLAHNSAAQWADTVILVGSENHSTWGFAKTLHDALHQSGLRVHTAAMNQLASEYRHAQRLLILTATYGDGDAPASARQFLARLTKTTLPPGAGFAVLGFGDRQFPQFCQFAKVTETALLERGWPRLLALETIDRQSTQAFARWGNAVGQLLGQELALVHKPVRPRSQSWQLVERVEYGAQVQAPTSVLRFKAAAPPGNVAWLKRLLGASTLGHFEAGDLLGIVPPGSPVPRFYSLASGSADGVLEICVRKHPGGLCSGFLHDLPLGARMDAFIQPNPDFRPGSGKAPVILIGAGTGIGPLAGFIRNNRARHPMHLYWGGRNPASDFLYEPELNRYLADRRLSQLNAAFSRVNDCSYVQDRILADALHMRRLIEKGAQILVCGSREMAKSVMQALDHVLLPLNLNVLTLKAQGRYREDVY
ncbi:PepSY domain-containing protein [Pseudomonas sp. SA3-5]|uniref:PepSY domain-containing protein n=1 Tax=Pseudomonas aestuarii TaxID=3018340 RepID=A0ABT4XJD0_9PSED|nr:PepSY domain-containing protein [Pseudomonas aestuarii]MDA7088292.1 PepSY domain-containing protein [Pseudomonas aestuarii]